MDSHCMYQNKAKNDLLVHDQLCFLSEHVFSFCSCRVNSESAMAQAQLALKGIGRWDSVWFSARYALNTPITH